MVTDQRGDFRIGYESNFLLFLLFVSCLYPYACALLEY